MVLIDSKNRILAGAGGENKYELFCNSIKIAAALCCVRSGLAMEEVQLSTITVSSNVITHLGYLGTVHATGMFFFYVLMNSYF